MCEPKCIWYPKLTLSTTSHHNLTIQRPFSEKPLTAAGRLRAAETETDFLRLVLLVDCPASWLDSSQLKEPMRSLSMSSQVKPCEAIITWGQRGEGGGERQQEEKELSLSCLACNTFHLHLHWTHVFTWTVNCPTFMHTYVHKYFKSFLEQFFVISVM